MPLISTESIILQSHHYSETSKILRLLTRDYGVRSVIAKGALRPRSQYGGVLEPFSVGKATIYLKEGRDLHTLSGFDLTRTGQGLGKDLVRFGVAALVSEVILRTGSEETDQSLFDQALGALIRIETASAETLEVQGLAEAWSLIARLGFAPVTGFCIGCDRELGDDEPATFDYAAGGPRCTECGGASGGRTGVSGGRTLPAHARLALARFIEGDPVPLERTAAHWALLSRFLAYHVADGRPIRSIEFLIETLGELR